MSESIASPRHLPKRRPFSSFTQGTLALKSFILMIVRKEQQVKHAMHFLLATEGKSFERSLSAFGATTAGRDLLQRRPKSWGLFSDRTMLHACPPASLGRCYADFIAIYGLDEGYYLDAVVENGERLSDDAARVWFRTRVDASHDMRHVLAGYGPDELGETCLLTFRFGQTGHAGVLALALFGSLKLRFTSRGPVFGPVLEAYQRGRRARLLDLLPWEVGFAQPLSAHRETLCLTSPRRYPSSFAPGDYVNSGTTIRQDAQSEAEILGGSV